MENPETGFGEKYPAPTLPPHMTPISPSDVKITILEGPWEFRIPIENEN